MLRETAMSNRKTVVAIAEATQSSHWMRRAVSGVLTGRTLPKRRGHASATWRILIPPGGRCVPAGGCLASGVTEGGALC